MNKLQQDVAVWTSLQKEINRQNNTLEMIPSENFVSPAVLEALGSQLTNKYAEGYVGKRYYGGNQFIDEIESLAIERAKQLFNAEHVNVQPLSGSPANLAAYFALLEPGDTILAMSLAQGGHLTHGHPVSKTSKIFKFVHYNVKDNGELDYENIRELAIKHQAKLILAGYSAYSREIDYQKIQNIADELGIHTMADIAHPAGLIAAGLMNNPVPIFDIVTSTTHKTLRGPRGGLIMCKQKHAAAVDKAVFPGLQGGPHENNIAAKAVAFAEALAPEFKIYAQNILGNAQALSEALSAGGVKICFEKTENHLMLCDIRDFGINGKQAQDALEQAGITVNMNMIPNDSGTPLAPSGIRLGTPAITTRGFEKQEMAIIAELILTVLKNHDKADILEQVNQKVRVLCAAHPLAY
ncbi:MAG TPA: serine hydroxymethyltransferase [bacterium]|nr:serine hydroxymethyltransferase [bacterium]